MKNLLLILALFVGSSFAEEEYPIELTCELSPEIVYISVGKTPKDSWIRAHETSKNLKPHALFFNDKFHKKINPKSSNFSIGEKIIKMEFTNVAPLYIYISRLTGTIHVINSLFFQAEGQCFKGFKEYKERKF